MPVSRSEGDLDSRNSPLFQANQYHDSHDTPGLDGDVQDFRLAETRTSPERGRRMEAVKSKTNKSLNNHQLTLDCPQPTRKDRSRSPHKKIFNQDKWFSRSKSVKEIATERKMENHTEGEKKTGIKQWSEKFRQLLEESVSLISKIFT